MFLDIRDIPLAYHPSSFLDREDNCPGFCFSRLMRGHKQMWIWNYNTRSIRRHAFKEVPFARTSLFLLE